MIEIWRRTTEKIGERATEAFPQDNPINIMVTSGARGNYSQIRQLAGMRGLMANPKGEFIPRPIKSNFREGLTVLEYFISTHGARKGLADTALRTAESGYLTRRLVDVAQDVIVREADCGTDRGLVMPIGKSEDENPKQFVKRMEASVVSRQLSRDVVVEGEVLAQAGDEIKMPLVWRLVNAGVEELRARSVLLCDSKVGVCAMCYGRSLASGKLVDVGEAIGIIAAQSIGEPGTQLTMRTFHTGGVAGEDITHGMPRVVELFEARTPRGVAPIAEADGVVRVEDTDKTRKIIVEPSDGSAAVEHKVSRRSALLIEDGQEVTAGVMLVKGVVDPKQVLRIQGPRAVQKHLVDQVQSVYRNQGVTIHDKHIEVIIRQMLRRVTIIESGDADFLTGELVDRRTFEKHNRAVVADGGRPASGRPELMGITKASLATDSWLSAASFQETTRVLTDAAMNSRSDPLVGLKENVILGKLIPAGTGMPVYSDILVEPTEEAKNAMYPAFTSFDESVYQAGFADTAGPSVPLDDFDAREDWR